MVRTPLIKAISAYPINFIKAKVCENAWRFVTLSRKATERINMKLYNNMAHISEKHIDWF